MKKTLFMILAVLMVVAVFAACTPPAAPADEVVDEPADDMDDMDDKPDEVEADEPEDEQIVVESEPSDEGFEVAMITDKGEIDDKSFNQSTWEGIVEYAEANDKSYKYYKPLEVSDDAYLAAIELAITGGAKIVVCPGFLFGTAIYKAQDMYLDTNFVIVDVPPNNGDFENYDIKVADNTFAIIYKEEQVGFLAGVAAVKDGYTKIGYLGGMAVPAVVKYGYGFVQGAEYAAAQMGIDSIELKYHYTGDFADTPENQTMAASWYGAGTEIIFAAGGKVGNSAMSAAEAADAKVIGVDVDQSGDSETVITSAMKGLGTAVKAALADFYAGTFKGSVTDIYDISVPGGVGLEMANSKFTTFTQADYDALVTLLSEDATVAASILDDTGAATPADLPTEIVVVTFFE